LGVYCVKRSVYHLSWSYIKIELCIGYDPFVNNLLSNKILQNNLKNQFVFDLVVSFLHPKFIIYYIW